MARKRSLKDAAVDQSVEKNEGASEAAASVDEEVKTAAAERKKAARARKRSLKDAAADQLIEKNKAVPVEPVASAETPAAEPIVVEATPAERAKESAEKAISAGKPLFTDEPSPAIESGKKGQPSLKWIAILLLIGFAAGFFFGVGRAIGPANVAFLLFGFLGGYLFCRFFKII